MKQSMLYLFIIFATVFGQPALADKYAKTIAAFERSNTVKPFLKSAYGYAVFPTIGKVGIGVGGSHGKGRVFRKGKLTGTTTVTQLTVGFQLGGQAFSQLILFKDKPAYDTFISGNFEFGAQANAILVTTSAGAQANSSSGVSAGAQEGVADGKELQAKTKYYKGMLTFTRGKGGLMYEASIGGQKFSFDPI